MKNSKYYIVLFCFFVVIACEDNLDLEPLNSTTEETFFTSVKNLETALFGIYDALQQNGVFGDPIYLEGMSDNCISEINFVADIWFYAAGDQVVATDEIVDFYHDNYILIQRANLLLDNIDEVSGITDTNREIVRAEAKALRAISYMKLIYLFGDVPFLTTFTDRNEVLGLSRTSKDVILDFILQELSAAASVIDNAPISDGRLTKQAVLGFRARILLYEARMGNMPWTEALAAIELAIAEADNGGHALVDNDDPDQDYQSLFLEVNEGNQEFIFSVRNSSADQGRRFIENYSWQAGVLFMYIHQNLADAYPYADGSAYNPSDNTFENRDPRLSANIMHEGLTFNGLVYNGTDEGGFVGGNALSTITNLFLNKFVTTDYTSTFNDGRLDIPVIRYADLLLMQAEALNETGGDGHLAINLVRDRAGLPALAGLTQEELREAIILERRLEFALEGLRWFDLITLGIADEVINAIEEEAPSIQRGFTPGRSELLPIPQTELGLNPNLTQNPGY